MEKKERARIEAHVAVVRKLAAQLTSEADRLEEMLNEQPTPGQLAKQLLDFFCEQWGKKYRDTYVVANGAKEIAALKRLLDSLTAREIAERMKLFLMSGDTFHINARHNLSLFPSALNKLKPTTEFALSSTAVGCKHKPRCDSDAIHTARVVREARTQ
jgi:hypothetical protein